MQSPFPRRDGSGRVTRARASYTLGLAAICACSPWPWGHVAPSGRMRSGAPVGERAALRRAWRGVGRGARGRGGAGRRVGRGGGAVWGGVPLPPPRAPSCRRRPPSPRAAAVRVSLLRDYTYLNVKLSTETGDSERGYPDREATVGKFSPSPTSHASQSLIIGSHNISWPTPTDRHHAMTE